MTVDELRTFLEVGGSVEVPVINFAKASTNDPAKYIDFLDKHKFLQDATSIIIQYSDEYKNYGHEGFVAAPQGINHIDPAECAFAVNKSVIYAKGHVLFEGIADDT